MTGAKPVAQTLCAPRVGDDSGHPSHCPVEFDAPRANMSHPGGFVLTFVLTTNIMSELRKARSGKAGANAAAWAATTVPGSLFV
jgi:hypothetical protein